MSSETLDSSPATRPPSDHPRRAEMTPFTCFIRLHAVNRHDSLEQAALRLVWDNLSEEDREPYRALASMNVPRRPSLAVTREPTPENSEGHNVEQEGTRVAPLHYDSDSWGSTPTLVDDISSSSPNRSQESIAAPVSITREQYWSDSDEDQDGDEDNDGDISSALSDAEDASSPDNLPL